MTPPILEQQLARFWSRVEMSDATVEGWIARDHEFPAPFKVLFYYEVEDASHRRVLAAHFSGGPPGEEETFLRGHDAEGFYRRISGNRNLPRLEPEDPQTDG